MGQPEYFPRDISLVVPLGESIHQFIIVGKDQVGALAKITEAIARHNVNLLTGGTYGKNKGGDFLFSIFADLAGAACTPEDLASELGALPFVSKVSFSHTEEAIYDQHMFPVVLFEANRAVLLAAESITFMERDLQRQIGRQGLQVLFEVGRSSGINLAALHKNMLPDADRNTLLATAKDDMRAQGWGLVSIELAERDGAKTKVTVEEPIFAGIEGARESWWLMGLVSGFLEAIYGHRTVVSGKTSFLAESRVFSFELSEYNPDSRSDRELT
ncbi:MAG: hypothetical protein ABSG45_00895 [Nitrososphaerales archaeon]